MDHRRRRLLIGGSIIAAGIVSAVGPGMCSLARNGRTFGANPAGPPKRPPGEPAPLLEEDLTAVLARLDAWYATHLRSDKYRFNPPARDADLDKLQALVGFVLPQSYRQLYRWHDGEDDDRWGHFYGLPLLPLDRVADQWTSWNRILAGLGGDRYIVPGASWPPDAVDPAYIGRKRLALTADGSGNSIGLDFDPWPGGRAGQVILFGRDEDVKAVLAPSLGTFLAWIADLLEGGNFRLGIEPGETVLREFRLKWPQADHFHEGARELLGAPGPFL